MVLSDMAATFHPRLETLPEAQQLLWGELIDVPADFVLYGGTAVALHLGHRQSVDFDFFGTNKFDPDELLQSISFLGDATVLQKSAGTLTALVDRGGPVQVSFFGVPKLGRLRSPLIAEDIRLQVADLPDLAGTKAAVVQKRAEAKDYIDLDALIHRGGIGLPLALAAGRQIYGRTFNPEVTLKALTYFGEGNLHTVPHAIRDRLAEAVRAVDLDRLPAIEPDGNSREPGSQP